MNVLIIGGAGYIGSHVTREFLDAGHNCAVFDNLSTGLRENLFADASFIHGDILDYCALERAAKGGKFDAAVHLAAFKAAGESMLEPEKYARNNIAGTVNVLNAVCGAGIKNIVFSSSAAVYGAPEYLPVDEKHPTEPENFYGFTKLEIERVLSWYSRLKGIRYASLRYFNAAGYDAKGRVKGLEQNPANLIPVIMEAAAGKRSGLEIFGGDWETPDGTCLRDYVHVTDLARGHVSALAYIEKEDKNLTVNLGNETGISVMQVLEQARKITGKPIPARITGRRAGDPERLYSSSSLALELLGWKAENSSLETLLKTSWDAYQKKEGTE